MSSCMTHPLKAWLSANGRSQKWLAEQIDVREATVSDWITRKTFPRPDQVKSVQEATDGGVTVIAWYQDAAA